MVPDALFLSIKNETLAQIFEPYGKSHPDIWPSLKNENPIGLLIRYRKRDLSRSVCVAVGDAIREAGCEPKFLSDDNVKKLCLLLRHRNQVQHFEEHPPYKISHLQELLKQVWNNFWIVNFLKKSTVAPDFNNFPFYINYWKISQDSAVEFRCVDLDIPKVNWFWT